MTQTGFVDYVVQDLLADIPGVRSRAMFGGFGIYKDDVIFAIVVDDQLYFKVDDTNRKAYEKAGSRPFVYAAAGGKRVAMSYWEVPAEALEDRTVLQEWAEKSYRINQKKRKARSCRPKPKKR